MHSKMSFTNEFMMLKILGFFLVCCEGKPQKTPVRFFFLTRGKQLYKKNPRHTFYLFFSPVGDALEDVVHKRVHDAQNLKIFEKKSISFSRKMLASSRTSKILGFFLVCCEGKPQKTPVSFFFDKGKTIIKKNPNHTFYLFFLALFLGLAPLPAFPLLFFTMDSSEEVSSEARA